MDTTSSKAVMQVIDEMKNRIVERFNPVKIILFGSFAKDSFGPDSDIDLLVIMDIEGSKRNKAAEIDLLLSERNMPLDVIVVTPEEFVRYRDIVGHIIYPAAHEGRILYERAA